MFQTQTLQVSLIAVGPLTNVALAIKMDPTFSTKLKHLYIMGGNMEGTEKARFTKKITEHVEKYTKVKQGDKEVHTQTAFVSCDSFAVAVAIDESVVTEYMQCNVNVELQGALTRGTWSWIHSAFRKNKIEPLL
ncbi:hypothetical protein chiPu_0006193 [Chiloscyllium punctatum]|uniref:Inosine/uridine-preferring nucleoside hydrolase domain-containing protein n=1 Tax=Chiloscyllium punctatum TaxID=137246 RepID=A0A401SBI8_CHIPU|nr:hypothetical protein [Chiloscyllium punctatum]